MDGPGGHEVRITLPTELLEEARQLNVDLSRACEQGLRAQVARSSKAAQWQEENRDAIRSYNEYVERNGLPLAEFRQF